MKHLESTLYMPLSLFYVIGIVAGVILLLLLLFVLRDPYTWLGFAILVIAISLIGFCTTTLFDELFDKAHTMGYEKPEP
jgi:hypothetical protein